MLQFSLEVIAADLVQRTIEGVVVPYGEVAAIQGVKYRFRPGSIKAARARTPLLVDHDRGRPIGVLAELRDEPSGAIGRFRVDATPLGDEALLQAASGSRGALSIGATVERYEGDVGGVVDVVEGRLHEVSLLALGAFEGANVLNVAAEAETPEAEPDPAHPEPEPDEPTPAPPADPEEGPMSEASSAAPMILAARDRPPRELDAGEYVHAMLRAQRGDRDAVRLLEAALTESISTDIPGLLPPTYEAQVIGPSPVDRILYNVFKGKALPGVGLQVQKPVWTTLPAGAWAANVDADATSSKAIIGLNPATIERWDWGTAIPYTVVQRSSPDAISTVYAAAVQNFYLAVEIRIALLLQAATINAAVKIGAGIAAFYTASGRVPEVVIVAPDVWGTLADAGVLSVPYGVSGNVIAGGGGLSSSYAGLPIVCSGALTAGGKFLATRRALDVRITDPAQLTANAIGALNVELGVVGEGLFDVDVSAELMKLTAGSPVGLDTAAAPASGGGK